MRKNKTDSQKERKIRSQCVIAGEQNEETVVEPLIRHFLYNSSSQRRLRGKDIHQLTLSALEKDMTH